jgi:hypothetical protein
VLGTNLFIDGHPSSRTTPFSEYDWTDITATKVLPVE